MTHRHEQLHSIHAMHVAGHRSAHQERHGLLLFGAVRGFASAISEWVIRAYRFPDNRQRAGAAAVADVLRGRCLLPRPLAAPPLASPSACRSPPQAALDLTLLVEVALHDGRAALAEYVEHLPALMRMSAGAEPPAVLIPSLKPNL